jgi:hypothetical protein
MYGGDRQCLLAGRVVVKYVCEHITQKKFWTCATEHNKRMVKII